MTQRVQTISCGYANIHFYRQNNVWLTVDAGAAGWAPYVFHRMEHMGIESQAVRLLAVTHAHFDHVGIARAIRDRCRCKVAAHPLEAELLENATFVIPPGTNRLTDGAAYYGRRNDWVLKLIYEFLPTPVDILTEAETTLSDFGFSARMIPTPGHTAGSMSVLTETGEAFIGDLAINYAPVWPGPSIPPFGESVDEILGGWRRLLEAGAKRFYPGHGPSFPADQLAQALDGLEHSHHRI